MFRILSDNPDLLENPDVGNSGCGSIDADDSQSDDSTADEEVSGNVDDCDNSVSRTHNISKKRRKIV